MTPSDKFVEEARKLAGNHYYCEDGWYSCPLATDGCFNDSVDKTKCNCGLEERVHEIALSLSKSFEEGRQAGYEEGKITAWEGCGTSACSCSHNLKVSKQTLKEST